MGASFDKLVRTAGDVPIFWTSPAKMAIFAGTLTNSGTSPASRVEESPVQALGVTIFARDARPQPGTMKAPGKGRLHKVRVGRLELPRIAAPDPKSGLSTISTHPQNGLQRY